MSEADDQRLLKASADGDRGAFETFVQRYQAVVFRYLRNMTGEEADAEDALQETFVAAWRGAAGFRGGPSARGWIFAVARNALRRSTRRRVGEPAAFDSLETLGLRAGWGDEVDPLDGLARKELLALALSAVPPAEREVLVLRELEGLSGEEVAETLGITLAAMKSRLHRGRLHLVAALREVANG